MASKIVSPTVTKDIDLDMSPVGSRGCTNFRNILRKQNFADEKNGEFLTFQNITIAFLFSRFSGFLFFILMVSEERNEGKTILPGHVYSHLFV